MGVLCQSSNGRHVPSVLPSQPLAWALTFLHYSPLPLPQLTHSPVSTLTHLLSVFPSSPAFPPLLKPVPPLPSLKK